MEINKLFTGDVKKPRDLNIEETGDKIRIILDGNKVTGDNMQIPANAFEGWAVAIRACLLDMKLDQNVVLDVAPAISYIYEKTKGQGHLARFLYRAMRFDEQYDWFELSASLAREVDKFREFLKTGTFINNIAVGEAGNTDRVEDENTVEEALAQEGVLKSVLSKTLDIGDNPVYRQLPVGLFKNEVSKDNSIFTYGKSAIDLWTYNGTEINVVELKFKNRMIGIITEIFFYSNFMYDLVTENGWFVINDAPDKIKARGYEKLTSSGLYESINGIMLADKAKGFHPLVSEKAVKVLNDSNNSNISYHLETYEYKCDVWNS